MAKSSQFGCFFMLKNEPVVGSRLEMEIALPPEILGFPTGTVHVQGEVVRVKKLAANGKTGVICAIEKYHLAPVAPDVEGEPIADK